ncbi:MAG TPA: type II toxin-antitoxin system RelE/ParE family toxin [Tepidisphaeraceae bacterium]|jgi:hypothetical protein
MWSIHWTEQFGLWVVSDAVDEAVREDIRAGLLVLREIGPALGRPLADTLKGSRHANMKELRVQSKGRPFRIIYALDPNRDAILLIGGNKQGNKRFYEKMIPLADHLFDNYLQELKRAKKRKA